VLLVTTIGCSKSTSDQCSESDQLKFVQNQIRTK